MTTNENFLEPFRLSVYFSERVWGRHSLAPWYSNHFETPVGEAWLTGEQCVAQTGPNAGKSLSQIEHEFGAALLGEGIDEFPLLVKMLFPVDKLSVQVHPNDAQAAAMGGEARGKTECWYVLEAEPGATLSLGLKPGTTTQMVQDALGSEAFEALLHEEPVVAGDLIFVEAGTVHAIGPGLVLLEVQQMSDTTYRLYDYGRPRELHLADGMKVIRIENKSGKIAARNYGRKTTLIANEFFVVERWDARGDGPLEILSGGTPDIVAAIGGSGVLVSGETRLELKPGQAIIIPACCERYSVEGDCVFARSSLPRQVGG